MSNDTLVASTEVVYEDQIEEAHKISRKIFGPVGKILYPLPDNALPNATLTSQKFGKIWYGDLQVSDRDNILMLESRLGDKVYLTLENY